MSIRMVAVELYRIMKKIEELEKELESLEAGSQERVEIERDLREARVKKTGWKNDRGSHKVVNLQTRSSRFS